jgi:S-adenosylmethionine hydrolase
LPNNGIVSIIDYLDYTSKKYIVQVEKPEQLNWVQFSIMVMAEICNSIQKNTALDEIGTFTNNYKLSFPLSNGLQINDNYIYYRIIYIDSYSNAVTNLHIDDFREHVGNKPFKTSLMGKYMIEKVSKNYQDVDESSYVGGIFNDLGFFEIFLSIGELCSQLKITKKSAIKLKLEY